MKKRSRCQRSSEALQQSSKTPAPVSVRVKKRQLGNKQRPAICHNNAANYSGTSTQKCSENKTKSAGRLSTAVCRLCHGKFSPRSLRHAFNKLPQESGTVVDGESDAVAQSPLLFHSDFQRLVGVQLDRDPRLSDFVCKKCHTKFYKCHSILIRFRQRVNLPPVGKENSNDRKSATCAESSVNSGSTTSLSFSSDPKCLHSLVSWAHQHGEACRSCPDLKEVLEGQCWGSVKAVWCCVDGHSYTMDTRCSAAADALSSGAGGNGAAGMSEDEGEEGEEEGDQELHTPGAQHSPSAVAPQAQRSLLADWTIDTDDFAGPEEAVSPALVQLEETPADSDLSDGIVSEDEESRKAALSEDELFEPYSHKRARRVAVSSKRRPHPKDLEEPKLKKKPGPKPGWKTKFKPKGEDLPNIYKCPYSGCTAVYRAPDGLKKHIKEHHEEVRERPCPHPGCNKVFMIDRYLQRHIKLIHTEERNYICDQCGQTFKQRKHLSVHQMRHSGAKPLQCEVCGFQCRQRASLKYHMTKHKAEADLEFACLMCGKRFEKAHNLNVHMSMVHPLVQAKVQQPPALPTPPLPPQPPYSNLHTISLSGEVVQQEHDR